MYDIKKLIEECKKRGIDSERLIKNQPLSDKAVERIINEDRKNEK